MFEGKYVRLSDDRYMIQIGEEGQVPVEIGVLVWEDVPDYERPVRYSYMLQTEGMTEVHEDIIPGLASLEGDARESGAHRVRDVRFDAWTNAGASAQSEPCGCAAADEPVACGCAESGACCGGAKAESLLDEFKVGATVVLGRVGEFIVDFVADVKGGCPCGDAREAVVDVPAAPVTEITPPEAEPVAETITKTCCGCNDPAPEAPAK